MGALIFALIGLLAYFAFNGSGQTNLTSDDVTMKYRSSESRPERREILQPELKEVPSGDPRIRNFVDAEGRRAKMIRNDGAGRPVVEIDYRNGEELKVERLFSEDGKLMRERRFRNDLLQDESTFR